MKVLVGKSITLKGVQLRYRRVNLYKGLFMALAEESWFQTKVTIKTIRLDNLLGMFSMDTAKNYPSTKVSNFKKAFSKMINW